MRYPMNGDEAAELYRLVESGAARAIRERAGWSRADLAANLGVSDSSVARWEHGATRPRRSDAARYLKLLRELEGAAGDEGER